MPPASASDELSNRDVQILMSEGLATVKDNFAPEHLTQAIHDYLLPISVASCQGLFATTMMFAAAMPALTNGAAIELWTQKPSPLAMVMIHVAPPQKGKSRLFQAVETLYVTQLLLFLDSTNRGVGSVRCHVPILFFEVL